MIRATSTLNDGRKLMIFGLSEENIKRLQAGNPIVFATEDMNIPGFEVMIVAGKTEKDIYDELKGLGKITEKKDKTNEFRPDLS